MKSRNNCSKTALAGDDGQRVICCDDCRAAEIEAGAVSLRLGEAAFRNFFRLTAAVRQLDGCAIPEPHAFDPEMQSVH